MQTLYPASQPLRFAALRIYTGHQGIAIDLLSDRHPSHRDSVQLLLDHKMVPIPLRLKRQIKTLARRMGEGIGPTPVSLPRTLRQWLAPIFQQGVIPEREQRQILYTLGQRFARIPDGFRLWSGAWLPLSETGKKA